MTAKSGKKQGGRFKPGESGNPKGRPQGSRNSASIAAQALLDGEAQALTRRAVEMALAGDTTALRLCLERLLPTKRERTVELKLPTVAGAADLPKATRALLSAVARGELSPGEAEKLAGIVSAHGKALELADLEERLAELERQLSKRS